MSKVDLIARAVLYEGYLLYPYRASSVKNRQRFTFGGVYPPAFDTSAVQTQVLVQGDERTPVEAVARFLQLVDPDSQQVQEREVRAPGPIAFDPIEGRIDLERHVIEPGVLRVTARIVNRSPARPADREDALRYTMLSTHIVLSIRDGAFVSAVDPPEELKAAAATCHNQGLWPVLVGEAGERDTMLCSPIILEDYPRVAEESQGDMFDATEIDELLSLSVMALTDEEKDEMRATDERARQLLERTESMTAEQMMRLHGTMRSMRMLRDDGP